MKAFSISQSVPFLFCVLQSCSYPKYTEIVVSDGGSTDDTVEKVREFAELDAGIEIKLVETTKGRFAELHICVVTNFEWLKLPRP